MNKKKVYSHSRLSSFEQCKIKFKFKYIDKYVPDVEETIESLLGKCAHESLEWLYKKVKEKNIPIIDDLIVYYTEIWRRMFNPDIVVVKDHLNPQDYFNKGIKFLLDYYTTNYPFADNTIELEKKIEIVLDKEKNFAILGFIDRLVHNIETGEYEIHDYKTSGTLPTQEKINSDRQLGLYAIAIKEIFGKDKKVCLNWHYLNFNKKICSRRTDQELEKLKKETIKLIEEIEATTEFPAQKSMLCNWCEYKNICPAHGNIPPKIDRQKEIFDFEEE